MTVYRQGDADGLCGMYSLLHFLKTTTTFKDEEATVVLRYLLDAARHFGWLNPFTLTQGFEDYQIKAILDLQIENFRLDYSTVFLKDAMKSRKFRSVYALLESVIRTGGSAIVSSKRLDHWLCVTLIDGSAQVVNSDRVLSDISLLSTKRRSFSPEWGVVILPYNRPVPVLNLKGTNL